MLRVSKLKYMNNLMNGNIEEIENRFITVVANPPYSTEWDPHTELLKYDDRFKDYGKLAPKSKADFAFLLHGFYHLKDTGTMGIVLPHGVLFRGGAEGVIRQTLLELGSIDAVIGLPANIFYGTPIPTTIIILKKNRSNRDVLFIDASQDFEKRKNQNFLLEEHIEKIISTYKQRQAIEKYAYIASLEEIEENDYNLNIPRYVDTFEEEEAIDLAQVQMDLDQINSEIVDIEKEINSYLNELGVLKHD